MANLPILSSSGRLSTSPATPMPQQGSSIPAGPLLSLPPKIGQERNFLAGRLYGEKQFSIDKVSRAMENLWNTRGTFSGIEAGRNLFVFRFTQEADRDKVLKNSPWSYAHMLLALIPHNGVDAVPLEAFKEVAFWIQIHDLPFTHLTTDTGYAIGKEIGNVLEVDSGENQLARYGFVRVRIVLQIEASLKPDFPLLYGKEESKVTLKYENLPNFFLWCGVLTHVKKHCPLMKKNNPTGEEPLKFNYKEMRARFFARLYGIEEPEVSIEGVDEQGISSLGRGNFVEELANPVENRLPPPVPAIQEQDLGRVREHGRFPDVEAIMRNSDQEREEKSKAAAAANYLRKGKSKVGEDKELGHILLRPSFGPFGPPQILVPARSEPGFLVGRDAEDCYGDTRSESAHKIVPDHPVQNVFPVLSDCPAHPCTHFYPSSVDRPRTFEPNRIDSAGRSPVRSTGKQRNSGGYDDVVDNDSVASAVMGLGKLTPTIQNDLRGATPGGQKGGATTVWRNPLIRTTARKSVRPIVKNKDVKVVAQSGVRGGRSSVRCGGRTNISTGPRTRSVTRNLAQDPGFIRVSSGSGIKESETVSDGRSRKKRKVGSQSAAETDPSEE